MAGTIPEIRDALESHDKRLDAVEKLLKRTQAQLADALTLIGGGPLALRALGTPEVIVPVRISVVVNAANGIYTAVPIMLDATAGTQSDDDDNATAFTVYAGPGSIPFVGCRCFVRFMGTVADVPVWWTMWGEDRGFRAKLTGAVDGSYTYPWAQVDNAPGTSALTSATGSLGRCLDKASAAYDSDVTVRNTIPTNTEVTLHWNYTSGKFEFLFGPEQDVEDC